MSNLTTRRKYNAIDACKLLMAIFVVAIHTGPLENCTRTPVQSVYDSIVSLAVPFFFLSSGFLLAKKFIEPFENEENENLLIGYLRRILKLYITWTAIYLPLAVYHFIYEGIHPIKAILLYIRGLIFVGEQYNSWPLWYLLSTIYAILLVYSLYKKKVKLRSIVVLGTSILAVSIGIDYFVELDRGGCQLYYSLFKN